MDVVKVVDQLANLGYIRTSKISGDWYQCYCPFHNGGNERKPSFGILLVNQMRGGQRYQEGMAHCFACGYVSTLPEMISEIFKRRSIPRSGYEWMAENVPGFVASAEFDPLLSADTIDKLNSKFAVDYIQTATQTPPSFVPEEELAKYRYTVQYMYDRKLTDAIIEQFDVGFDANWIPEGRKKPVPCVTFPVRDQQGRTLFLCRRSIEGKFFNYPRDVIKPVYGIDQIRPEHKSVIICESCFNALTAWVYGYPAVALLGTGGSYQLDQLRSLGVREFVIMMDGDEAGQRATKKLKRALSDIAIVWSVKMPPDKDINDCSKDEFLELYSSKE